LRFILIVLDPRPQTNGTGSKSFWNAAKKINKNRDDMRLNPIPLGVRLKWRLRFNWLPSLPGDEFEFLAEYRVSGWVSIWVVISFGVRSAQVQRQRSRQPGSGTSIDFGPKLKLDATADHTQSTNCCCWPFVFALTHSHTIAAHSYVIIHGLLFIMTKGARNQNWQANAVKELCGTLNLQANKQIG